MELNLFRSGTWPSDGFRADLEALATLSPDALQKLRHWFLGARQFTPLDWNDYAEIVKGGTMSVEEFERNAGIIQYVLDRWKAEGITFNQLLSDFSGLGLPPESTDKLQSLFAGLEEVAARVRMANIRNFHESVVLPTVEDVNIVCDLRPLFADPAYEEQPMGRAFDTLLGFSIVFLMEISATHSNGGSVQFNCQMSERDFDSFLEGLQRAKTQREVLLRWKTKVEEQSKS